MCVNWRDNRKVWGVVVLLVAGLLWKAGPYLEQRELERQEGDRIPAHWKRKVRTPGQFYPVPAAWLVTPEGREAHFLVLPASLPKPVPFDFAKAGEGGWWPDKNRNRRIGYAYFKHLCATEGGKWIFRKVPEVKGLFVARRTGYPASSVLSSQYGLELPWMERNMESIVHRYSEYESIFISPPNIRFEFVEQPTIYNVLEREIGAPYVRLSGLIVERIRSSSYFGKAGLENHWYYFEKASPLQAKGLSRPSAEYAYTWRGVTRPRDREFGVAGGEIIIYQRESKEILGVIRTFSYAPDFRGVPGKVAWVQVPTCEGVLGQFDDLEAARFAQEVLNTPPGQGVRIRDDRYGF